MDSEGESTELNAGARSKAHGGRRPGAGRPVGAADVKPRKAGSGGRRSNQTGRPKLPESLLTPSSIRSRLSRSKHKKKKR